MTYRNLPIIGLIAIVLSGCSSAVRFTSASGGEGSDRAESDVSFNKPLLTIEGTASFYSYEFNGEKTASGDVFNRNAMTAAHREFPFGTVLRVTNLENGKVVIVTVNDRGPERHDRILDLSEAAARKIDMIKNGTARVRIEVLKWGKTSTR
ncbi:MAG: septal ring lytic transglycosylase RlpA family protein [Candidatus Kryptoniota bacterium]